MPSPIIQKLVSLSIVAVLIVAFSVIAVKIIKPNQQTPLISAIPTQRASVNLPSDYTIAAWVWKYPSQLKGEFAELVDFAQAEKINTLYINIDEYIDIYEMKVSADKDKKLNEYFETVKGFITLAKSKNIKIQALSGNTAYSYDSHEYIPPIILRHVFDFNQQNPDAQFDGIQFDIEFYDDPRYFGDSEGYTLNYLKLVKTLADETGNLNKKYNQKLRLGFSIPFWFDRPNDYFKKPILSELINTLSAVENSYFVVMSYRDVISGDGSVMAVSTDELVATEKTKVKVIIGQEIVQNKDQRITHFGKSRDQIKADMQALIDLARQYPSFEGISIHDLEALKNTR